MDWTGGLTLKIIFMLSNSTHSPVGFCGSPAALFLATYMVGKCFSCHYTILYIVTLKCIIIYNEQSDCMLGAILVPLYKHHLDYQMSVVL